MDSWESILKPPPHSDTHLVQIFAPPWQQENILTSKESTGQRLIRTADVRLQRQNLIDDDGRHQLLCEIDGRAVRF